MLVSLADALRATRRGPPNDPPDGGDGGGHGGGNGDGMLATFRKLFDEKTNDLKLPHLPEKTVGMKKWLGDVEVKIVNTWPHLVNKGLYKWILKVSVPDITMLPVIVPPAKGSLFATCVSIISLLLLTVVPHAFT